MTDDGPIPLAAVLISDRQERPLDVDALVRVAQAAIAGEGVGAAELSVSFVDEAEIEDLHLRYMDLAGPTDVLAFAQDVDTIDQDGSRILGDVIICPKVAASNNPTDPDSELRLLMVHGVLHLLGYDHEQDDERAQMWARQEAYSGVRTP